MKIAFVQQPISPMSIVNQEGSLDIWIYEIARRMAKYHDVVVYSKKGKLDKDFELHEGVKFRRLKTNIIDEWFARISGPLDKLFRSVFLKSKRPLFVSRLYYFIYALCVAQHLKYEKCDVVHLHTFPQFVPIIRAFDPKIKIVLEMHCEWLTQLDRKMIESRLEKTNLVVGVSEYITDKIRRRFPKFAHRCKTLLNGVDIDFFANDNRFQDSKKKNVKQLLFVGRISPEKGIHVLLDAFQMVFERFPRMHLTLIGAHTSLPADFLVGLSEDVLTRKLEQFHSMNYMSYLNSKLSPELAKHVTFTGSIPHRLVKDYYQTADVVVLPSVCNEACALPLFEAMAVSVPVVASRGGGTPEVIVDGKTGLLVERGDASALAEAVLRLVSDEALNKSMGEAGRKRAIELSWEQTAQNLCELYETMFVGDA